MRHIRHIFRNCRMYLEGSCTFSVSYIQASTTTRSSLLIYIHDFTARRFCFISPSFSGSHFSYNRSVLCYGRRSPPCQAMKDTGSGRVLGTFQQKHAKFSRQGDCSLQLIHCLSRPADRKYILLRSQRQPPLDPVFQHDPEEAV